VRDREEILKSAFCWSGDAGSPVFGRFNVTTRTAAAASSAPFQRDLHESIQIGSGAFELYSLSPTGGDRKPTQTVATRFFWYPLNQVSASFVVPVFPRGRCG
jgi:hypothetical protein